MPKSSAKCPTVRMFGQISQIRMLENCRPFQTLLAESSAVRKKYDHVTPLLKKPVLVGTTVLSPSHYGLQVHDRLRS